MPLLEHDTLFSDPPSIRAIPEVEDLVLLQPILVLDDLLVVVMEPPETFSSAIDLVDRVPNSKVFLRQHPDQPLMVDAEDKGRMWEGDL